MAGWQCLCYLALLMYGSLFVKSVRVKEKIYEELQSDMACFKRFNGTHEIGCTSHFSGNVGVVYVLNDTEYLSKLLSENRYGPYIIALQLTDFTPANLDIISRSNNVAGILVLLANAAVPNYMSGEKHCPNDYSSFYKQNREFSSYCTKNPWNPLGNDLLYTSFPFPIFLITNLTSIQNLYNCFNEHNNMKEESGEIRMIYPLCSVELKSNMYGTTNTEVCTRRYAQSAFTLKVENFCEPLQDYNLWGTLKPLNYSFTLEPESVIVVATRVDAGSMFDGISPGANSAVTGLVSILVAADALFRKRSDLDMFGKNVIFILFEGETWDYIGSSRVVYDMEKNEFPNGVLLDQEDQMAQLNLSHIHSFIEIEQIGLSVNDENQELFIHTDPVSNEDGVSARTEDIVSIFNSVSSKLKNSVVKRASSKIPLPPSSFQSFLKKKNISGLLLTNFEYTYADRYYESMLDDYKNVFYNSSVNEIYTNDFLHKHVAQVSSLIASSLYQLVTGKEKIIDANEDLTNQLLLCYLRNVNCSIFRDHSGAVIDDKVSFFRKAEPAKMYVSVYRGNDDLSIITGNVFSHLMGEEANIEEHDCKSNYTQMFQYSYFPYINNGTCIKSTVHRTEAKSPSFLIDNYNWSSGEYSTWTESVWSEIQARIFLQPSKVEELSLLCGGCVSLFISSIVVYFFNMKSNLIFPSSVSPSPC